MKSKRLEEVDNINRIAAGDYGYTAAIHAKEGNSDRAKELATIAANRAHRAGVGRSRRRPNR